MRWSAADPWRNKARRGSGRGPRQWLRALARSARGGVGVGSSSTRVLLGNDEMSASANPSCEDSSSPAMSKLASSSSNLPAAGTSAPSAASSLKQPIILGNASEGSCSKRSLHNTFRNNVRIMGFSVMPAPEAAAAPAKECLAPPLRQGLHQPRRWLQPSDAARRGARANRSCADAHDQPTHH